MIKYIQALGLLLGGTLMLSACASNPRGPVTDSGLRFLAPTGMNVKFGPCDALRGGGQESAVAAALIGKGVDLAFGALQAAGDPESGRVDLTTDGSTFIRDYDACVFIADGEVTGRAQTIGTVSAEFAQFKTLKVASPEIRQRVENEVVRDGAGNSSATRVDGGTGGDGFGGGGSTLENEPALSETPNAGLNETTEMVDPPTRNYHDLFAQNGIYFSDVPRFSGIFKIDYVAGHIRLLPYAMNFAERSRGNFLNFEKSRSLVLTFSISDPSDASKAASIGPFDLGRFTEYEDGLYDFGARNLDAPNHSLRPTPWVALPVSLKPSSEAKLKPANFSVTVTQIQKPSGVAAFAYEVLSPEQEKFKTSLQARVNGPDAPSAEETEISNTTALQAYFGVFNTTCAAVATFKTKVGATSVTLTDRQILVIQQRLANQAASQLKADAPVAYTTFVGSAPFSNPDELLTAETLPTEYGQTVCETP